MCCKFSVLAGASAKFATYLLWVDVPVLSLAAQRISVLFVVFAHKYMQKELMLLNKKDLFLKIGENNE